MYLILIIMHTCGPSKNINGTPLATHSEG